MSNSIYLLSVALLSMASCGVNKSKTNSAEPGTRVLNAKSVETGKPNTNYPPAFEGQTRVSAVVTSAAYEGKQITADLKSPWGITALPDGRLLVTQKKGSMVIVTPAGAVGEPITGIPAVNSTAQGGLLDVIIDPNFATNRMLYWTFSESVEGGNLTAVAKGKLSADEKQIENATVIYRALPAYNNGMHYGSRIVMDPAGNLLVSTGERSDIETRPLAQDLNAALGKIVRITKDGAPAAGNPFITRAGAKPEIYTYGHRNVQSLAYHPQTGVLWEAEFGPRGGDELNVITPGLNYGWPTITYGIEYSGEKVGEAITQRKGMEQPRYYWDPVLAPSGMAFYKGNAIAEWKNNLFICGLASQHIARLVITGDKVTGEERLLASEKQRFRAITNGTDGALYAVTDGGRMYRIGVKQ